MDGYIDHLLMTLISIVEIRADNEVPYVYQSLTWTGKCMYKKKGDRLLLRIATQEHGNTVKTQEDTNKMDDKGLKLFA